MKMNFTKQFKSLYQPSAQQFAVVDVPPMTYLMIDGHGNPNTEQWYKDAVEALFSLSYRLKFMSKAKQDYVVPPLEGLWWADDMEHFTNKRDKSSWDWTMMIRLPDWISHEQVEQARQDVRKKKTLASLEHVRVETYHEGCSAQILHIGSYDDEAPTLAYLHNEWLPQHGYRESGKHHEIYLSDARRVEPAKRKTILRQPIRPR